MKPVVSVVIPTFNRQAFIGEAIESVQKQTFSDWEMLIVDDASTDNTESIVKEYVQKDPRIKYYKNEKNLGIAKTRNKCLELSQGKYIAPLDSDDIWLDENKIRDQVGTTRSDTSKIGVQDKQPFVLERFDVGILLEFKTLIP